MVEMLGRHTTQLKMPWPDAYRVSFLPTLLPTLRIQRWLRESYSDCATTRPEPGVGMSAASTMASITPSVQEGCGGGCRRPLRQRSAGRLQRRWLSPDIAAVDPPGMTRPVPNSQVGNRRSDPSLQLRRPDRRGCAPGRRDLRWRSQQCVHAVAREEKQPDIVAHQRPLEALERPVQVAFEQSIFLTTERPEPSAWPPRRRHRFRGSSVHCCLHGGHCRSPGLSGVRSCRARLKGHLDGTYQRRVQSAQLRRLPERRGRRIISYKILWHYILLFRRPPASMRACGR